MNLLKSTGARYLDKVESGSDEIESKIIKDLDQVKPSDPARHITGGAETPPVIQSLVTITSKGKYPGENPIFVKWIRKAALLFHYMFV